MKKYLMTGIAALAMCAGFTSCSHDITPMSEEELTAFETQQIIHNYENAFQKVFGQPAPNHTWGFSDSYSAQTRSAETRANMWADLGYNVPVELTAGQMERVKRYYQSNKLEWGGSKDWTEFFIQQVYKGGTDPLKGTNPATGEPYSAEKYLCANGTDYFGSDNMDYLTCNGDAWDHTNNFNKGRYSSEDSNALYGNGKAHTEVQNSPGVTYHSTGSITGCHSDRIDLMVSSLATGFGYGNSAARKSYNDKYRMVSGAEIDAWAEQYDGGKGESVTGRDFVGFDFEQMYKDEDVFQPKYNQNWQPTGEYETFEFEGKTYRYVQNAPNKYCGDIQTFTDANKPGLSAESTRQWINDGYLPMWNNDKAWVKLAKCADGYFSDWIVCIAPAKGETTKTANLRVMAEDLSAGESGEDFDFNDVVFDVYFSPNVGEAYVMVQAAGGTLPLTVHGTEVHGLFEQPTNKMINTHAEDKGLNGISNLPAQKIPLTGIIVNSKSDVNTKVKIYVTKPVNGVATPIELVNSGAAACKIGVSPTITFADERVNVNSVCNFNQWVTEGGQLEPTNN